MNPSTSSPTDAKLVMRTIAMPAHTNYNGDIFGGWVVSEMDKSGGVIATRYARNKVTTVAIENLIFKKPIKQGDIVSFYAKVIKIKTTSIILNIEVWVDRNIYQDEFKVTDGTFIYVSIDQNGKPKKINLPS